MIYERKHMDVIVFDLFQKTLSKTLIFIGCINGILFLSNMLSIVYDKYYYIYMVLSVTLNILAFLAFETIRSKCDNKYHVVFSLYRLSLVLPFLQFGINIIKVNKNTEIIPLRLLNISEMLMRLLVLYITLLFFAATINRFIDYVMIYSIVLLSIIVLFMAREINVSPFVFFNIKTNITTSLGGLIYNIYINIGYIFTGLLLKKLDFTNIENT